MSVDLDAGLSSGGGCSEILLGIENVTGSAYDDTLFGFQGANRLVAGEGADRLSGRGGDDWLTGGEGHDTLIGAAGRDTIFGGRGRDQIIGGGDGDVLTGGAGHDLFRFLNLGDSATSAMDLITDLGAAHRIDLGAIDADTESAGDQAFHQVAVFSGHAAELQLTYAAETKRTTLALDIDGDGAADFALEMAGSHLTASGSILRSENGDMIPIHLKCSMSEAERSRVRPGGLRCAGPLRYAGRRPSRPSRIWSMSASGVPRRASAPWIIAVAALSAKVAARRYSPSSMQAMTTYRYCR